MESNPVATSTFQTVGRSQQRRPHGREGWPPGNLLLRLTQQPFRLSFSTFHEFWRHCVLICGTHRRALSRYQSEKVEWELGVPTIGMSYYSLHTNIINVKVRKMNIYSILSLKLQIGFKCNFILIAHTHIQQNNTQVSIYVKISYNFV